MRSVNFKFQASNGCQVNLTISAPSYVYRGTDIKGNDQQEHRWLEFATKLAHETLDNVKRD
jgi:hypothetical protein